VGLHRVGGQPSGLSRGKSRLLLADESCNQGSLDKRILVSACFWPK